MALEPSVIKLGSSRLLVVNGFERIWIGALLLALAAVLPLVFWWAVGELHVEMLGAMVPVLGLGVAAVAAPFVLCDVVWFNKRAGVVCWGFFGRRRCPLASVRAIRVVCPASGARGCAMSLVGQGPGAGDLALGTSHALYTPERFKEMARRLADFLGVPLEECQVG